MMEFYTYITKQCFISLKFIMEDKFLTTAYRNVVIYFVTALFSIVS